MATVQQLTHSHERHAHSLCKSICSMFVCRTSLVRMVVRTRLWCIEELSLSVFVSVFLSLCLALHLTKLMYLVQAPLA